MINLLDPQLMSWITIFVVITNLSVKAQTQTNLDIFKELVNQSIIQSLKGVHDSQENVYLNLKLGSSYKIFEDQIYRSVKSQKKSIVPVYNPQENLELNYTMENASVSYGEIFRDGFLGGYFVLRKIFISGSYRLQGKTNLADNFYCENVDTVKFDDLRALENSSYPFTQGEIPSEPFFSSLFEPIVAVTTAAVVIILFFSVRSK
jgi:hypothetical protein